MDSELTAADGDVRSDQAQEQKACEDAGGGCGVFGAAEVGVGGVDAAELDPPACGHERNGEAQKPEAEVSGEADEREEHDEKERPHRPTHDLEVAGVAAGLTDAAGGGSCGLCGGRINGRGAVRALAVGGVEAFLTSCASAGDPPAFRRLNISYRKLGSFVLLITIALRVFRFSSS